MPLNRQGGRVRVPPGGRARENRKFNQAPSPEIWSETISGAEGGSGAVSGVACFWATSLEEIIGGVIAVISFMDAAVYRAEVCYPFSGKHGSH